MNRIKVILFATVCLFLLPSISEAKNRKIQIKDGWFYINGEKYLVKGVAYSPWRPGELPWSSRPNIEKMEKDFKLIKEAGFNTIRTWSPLTEEELVLANKYNLMVIQGLWIDPVADPLRSRRDPNAVKKISEIAKKEAERFKDNDNILLFLAGNELPIEGIKPDGIKAEENMLKEVKNAIKKTDPDKYVSFANWFQTSFFDNSYWDAVCFNVYNYYPNIISHSMGFGGYIAWLKEKHAKNKPLLITEYGLSVSKKSKGSLGYGGNTPDEQAKGCVSLWDEVIQSGACGGCIFEWNDEWWKNYESKGDEDSHDDQPEEWFGILGIEGTNKNYTEIVRPLYSAIKEYNQAIIVNPKKHQYYREKVPIEIYAEENVKEIKAEIDGEVVDLQKRSEHWWVGEWKNINPCISSRIFQIEAIGINNMILCRKEDTFWSGLEKNKKEPMFKVSIKCKDKYHCSVDKKLITTTFEVLDENNKPVSNMPIKYSFYEVDYWQQTDGEKCTNKDGMISIDYCIKEPGYLIVSGGVDYKADGYVRRYGSIKIVEVVKKK